MDFSIYLAFTGAEWASVGEYGGKMAFMACRFSPWGGGISGVPTFLPPGSMLMLSDETPVQGHDPQRIAEEMSRAVGALGCGRVVLDFQRKDQAEYGQIVAAVREAVSCPVGVSEHYAKALDCPVLLSSPPLWTPLSQHLEKWTGREIWLEAVLEDATVTVTEAGSRYQLCDREELPQSHVHEKLHVRYRVQTQEKAALFHLRRDREQLDALLQEAEELGVRTAVGLYQQLGR